MLHRSLTPNRIVLQLQAHKPTLEFQILNSAKKARVAASKKPWGIKNANKGRMNPNVCWLSLSLLDGTKSRASVRSCWICWDAKVPLEAKSCIKPSAPYLATQCTTTDHTRLSSKRIRWTNLKRWKERLRPMLPWPMTWFLLNFNQPYTSLYWYFPLKM